MSRWFRHYAGMCSDPKFGGIARRAKVSRDRVVFVFAFILEGAAEQNDGGAFQWDADAVADLLNCDTDEIRRVHAELMAAGMIEGERVTKWASRQYEDRTNAERQARFKAKRKDNASGNGEVTQAERVTNAPHRTETETETEEAATAASSAGAAKIDWQEVERRCIQATGWQSTDGFSAIQDLVNEGLDLEERILPMLRTIAEELRNRGKPAPQRWAFVMKAMRDPTRRPMPEEKKIEMVWVAVGTREWDALARTKRESYLRTMLKTDGKGGEGLWWSKDLLPSARPQAQGAAA